jgi:hypothetical protein
VPCCDGGPIYWYSTVDALWDWTYTTNAHYTASDCRVFGLVHCGNLIYGNGREFAVVCSPKSSATVASEIDNAANTAFARYGYHGIVVHWSASGGYPPSCGFTADVDANVAQHNHY